MKLSSQTVLCALLALAFTSARAQEIVINEIMYHTPSENVLEEYIELYNRASTNVNLGGWSFTSGVAFTFPSNTILGSGQFLVVAANRQVFQTKYPTVTNVVGGWTGILNNHDQTIALENAVGQEIDRVRYADEGDWATRQRGPNSSNHRGWVWSAPHDGFGASLELMNAAMPNEYGQNWGSSAVNNPTPGRANTVNSVNLAPMILEVAHFPVVPRSTDNVSISARIVDESAANVTVRLRYRVDSATPPAFSVTNMVDDGLHGDGVAGDGIHGAVLPAQPNDTVVEFFVEATDVASNTRTWPGPAIAAADGAGPTGQVANALYQVDNNSVNQFGGTPSMQPVYKLIMTEAERAELQNIPPSGDRNSDAQMNGTFISLDGTETQLRYLCGFRNRGHGSRGANPPNYRVNFRTDDRWKGVKGLNLNSQNVPAQHFGAVLALHSGLAGADSRAVQLRVNNINRANSGGSQYGSYACNEALNGDWAARHFPMDGNGNVYRAIRDITPPEFDYRQDEVYPTLFGAESPDSYRNTWFKSSNESEDDWTDLIGMLRVMGLNGIAPFNSPNVRNAVNVEQWMLHLAVMALYANSETGLNSGYNDDYFMYRGVNDPRFILLYYDLDSVLGQSSFGTSDDIFHNTSNSGSGAAINRFIHYPDFEPIYYATLQRLLDTTFSATEFNALCDQTLGGYAPGVASSMKNWMNGRRAYVQSVINGLVPPATNNPVATISGEPRSPTPSNAATLSIGGNGITHYRYKLNSGAYSAETAVAATIQLSGLANDSTNTVYVIGRNSAGIYQAQSNATVSRTWIVRTSMPTVRLNEILARNVAALNHNGTYPDALELFNDGASAVDLTGMRLTDDASQPDKFTFPATTTLAAGAYLVVYANNNDGTPGFHLGFALNQNGDAVYLLDKASSGGALLDSVEFGLQLADKSIGRLGNGDWLLTPPSFGSVNSAHALGSPAALRINEWLTSGQSPFLEDFIELYNSDSLPVALGGLYLTDEPIGVPGQHRVAPLSFAPGGGFSLFLADGDASAGADHVSFKLRSEQGQIGLLAADLTRIDCVSYGPQKTGVAFGRCPDGGTTSQPLGFPTPGLPNNCPTTPPPLTTVTLVNYGSVWKYDQVNGYNGVNWFAPGFNDSAWPSGPGVIGVLRPGGSIPEPFQTPLTLGRLTYYFRSYFTVPADANFTSLQISHLIDDGAVVYLNGQEVYRYNLPSGVILSNTLATPVSGDPTYQGPFSLPASSVVPGNNVIAVEIHQGTTNSADFLLGLKLDGVIVTNSAVSAGVVINEVLANNPPGGVNGGPNSDWVELYNPSLNAVDLSNMSLSDSTDDPRRWVFPAGSFIPARSFYVIGFDPDLPVNGTNTGFGLNNNGDNVYLFSPPGTNGLSSVVDFVNFGLQIEEFTIGRVPDGGATWSMNIPTYRLANIAATLGDPRNLKINEWMAEPASGDDWFEIYNPNPQPVALGGLHVTDDYLTLAGRTKYQIPGLSFIGVQSNAFTRFEADNPGTPKGPEHVNFKLDKNGEWLGLSDASGALIDGYAYGVQQVGVSQGRLPDGGTNVVFFPETPTPKNANFLPLATVVVNEALAHTDLPLEDAIELRNTTGQPIDISGWWLSDANDAVRKFPVPPGTILPAFGFKVFYEYEFNDDLTGVPFSLSSAKGDEVYLSVAMGASLTGYRAIAKFGPSANGVSFGRYVNSVGHADYAAMSALSLGTSVTAQSPTNQVTVFRTGQGATNPYPMVGPIVISEIMYHPPDLGTNDNVIEEFIELTNTGSSTVPLYDPAYPTNGWRLRDAVDFKFNTSHSLPAGGSLLVVSFDPVTNAAARATFQARYGSNSLLIGPYSGKLDNSSESLELVKPDAPQTTGADAGLVPYVLVEKVVYQDHAPWPTNADGFGMSLQRIGAAAYANDPINWLAATPTPAPSGVMDSDGDGMPDDWEMANGLNKNNPADANQDADGDGLSNLQEYLAGTNPGSPASSLRLTGSLNGDMTELRFQAVAGKTYSVLYCDSLPGPAIWQWLRNIPAQGSDQTVVIEDSTAGMQRFYRVVTPARP